ncbi:MAG: hypothetical protein JO053_03790 [Acidobacteria bacterium]|nr:hypothetical protein [Acidobacteriota bacterium]
MLRFDSKALFRAIDTRREQRGLGWKQVANEMGIAEATIKRTRDGGRMEVDGMLAMIAWLGLPVEHFVRKTRT